MFEVLTSFSKQVKFQVVIRTWHIDQLKLCSSQCALSIFVRIGCIRMTQRRDRNDPVQIPESTANQLNLTLQGCMIKNNFTFNEKCINFYSMVSAFCSLSPQIMKRVTYVHSRIFDLTGIFVYDIVNQLYFFFI